MSAAFLSIDYGTSNTVAALRWPDGRIRPLLFDGSPALPSAVFLQPDGTLLTGRDAVHSARLDPARYEPNPKRRVDEGALLLGERAVRLADAVAATLRRVGAEAVRAAGGPPAGIVLTYPAGWGAVRRGTLDDAAGLAGLPAPVLVPEPVAATAYFTAVLGHAVRPGHVLVVYDLGAGTFDVSVVRRTADGFAVADVDGLADFGGLDLDALVVGRVAAATAPGNQDAWRRLSAPQNANDRRLFRSLWDDARAAKEMLSREPAAGLHVPLVEHDVLITRAEFEAAATPRLAEAAALTATVMRRAGVTAENLAGVFLVGGSSRVPLAATTLHRATGVAPTVIEQPETVVAEGALHAAVRISSQGTAAAGPPVAAVPAPAAVPGPTTSRPVVPPAAPTPPTSPVPPDAAPPDAASRAPAATRARLAGVGLLILPAVAAFAAALGPAETYLIALLSGIPGAMLLMNGLAWQPAVGSGFSRRRIGPGIGAVVLLVIASMAFASIFAGLRAGLSNPDMEGIGLAVTIFAAVLAAVVCGAVLLLRAYCRGYPRLIVDPRGLTYQPHAGLSYELPWADLARTAVASPPPGRHPALLAYPAPGSRLQHDPQYAALWRDDLGAYAIDRLDRLLDHGPSDARRLTDTIARQQGA